MAKYTVHVFPVGRIHVDVEADTQEEAIKKAEEGLNLYDAMSGAEYAEEVAYFLVDEGGDEDYQRTKWHRGEFEPYPVELSREDWAEIYYALESKIVSGLAVADPEWRGYLEAIMEKIGPDGEEAAKKGVKYAP